MSPPVSHITGNLWIPVQLCSHYFHKPFSFFFSETASNGNNIEASFNRQYIRQKLETGLVRIWQDVQHKVRLYILSSNLAYFKFDEFMKVLDIVTR